MVYRRAVIPQFGTPDVIQIQREETLPVPHTGEVRIKVEASSIVFTDTLIRKGIYPYLREQPPFPLGYDFVGVVDALGDGVSAFQVGDRVADVIQTGGNADYIVRPAASLIAVPPGIDPVQAETFLLSGMTAYQMLHRIARIHPGQRILVQGGTGAVGNMLVQLALVHGLQVVTTASANNLAMLQSLGAEAVDYHASDLSEQLRRRAGDGFHAAFDGIGMSSFRRSFNLLAPSGVLVPYGFVTAARMVKQKTMIGSLIGGLMFATSRAQFWIWDHLPGNRIIHDYDLVSYRHKHPLAYAEDIQQMFALLQSGQIGPLIHRTYPLEALQQAHEDLANGGIRGRLVITHTS